MRHPRTLLAISWLLILLSSLPKATPPNPLSSPGALVAGAVAGPDGFPLPGARVAAVGPEGYEEAVTDENGFYRIAEGLGTGEYTVYATAPGYATARVTGVRVEAGQETPGIDFLLPESGVVEGSVRDASTGNPIPGATVTASSPEGGEGVAFTDGSGFFRVSSGLGSGVYAVAASAQGYVSQELGGVEVTAGETTPGVEIRLPRSGAVEGRVTDAETGEPVRNATVAVSGGPYGGAAATDPQGLYRVSSGLCSGPYLVEVYARGFLPSSKPDVNVSEGQTTTVNIALTRSAAVRGIVLDAETGEPLEGALVTATAAEGGYAMFAVADGQGVYTIDTNLGTGVYSVLAVARGHGLGIREGIVLTAGHLLDGVVFELTPGTGGVAGLVVDASTGAPVGGARVQALYELGPIELIIPAGAAALLAGEAVAGGDGLYTIEGLAAGLYTVAATAEGYRADAVLSVPAEDGSVTGGVDLALVQAASGAVSGTVRVAVQPQPTTVEVTVSTTQVTYGDQVQVSGRLLDPRTGDGLPGMGVAVETSTDLNEWKPAATLTTGGDGSFACYLAPSLAGTLYIRVSFGGAPGYRAAKAGPREVAVAKAASRITLSPTPETLEEGSRVVVSGAIDPPRSATVLVQVRRPDGATANQTLTASSDGRFTVILTAETPGTWVVTASWEGDESHLAATGSRTLKVLARSPIIPILLAGAGVAAAVAIALISRRRKPRGPLPYPTPRDQPLPPAPPVREIQPAPAELCPRCGVPLFPGARFCTSCGTKVRD